jgi:hypothetical protein
MLSCEVCLNRGWIRKTSVRATSISHRPQKNSFYNQAPMVAEGRRSDNLGLHKATAVRRAILGAGARRLYYHARPI